MLEFDSGFRNNGTIKQPCNTRSEILFTLEALKSTGKKDFKG